MKKFLFSLIASSLLLFNLSSAQADPTYAVLDSNGNVTNIIVCGSACAGGEWDGNKVVLQVAADPTTNENRGGFWNGPGTTTYNENSGVFTVIDHSPNIVHNEQTNIENTSIIISIDENNITTENRNQKTIVSSATMEGLGTTSFKYEDTIGENLFIKNGWVRGYTDNTKATISVKLNEVQKTVLVNPNVIQEVIIINENGEEITETVTEVTETITNTVILNEKESAFFNNRISENELRQSINFSNLSLLNSKIETLISLLGNWIK